MLFRWWSRILDLHSIIHIHRNMIYSLRYEKCCLLLSSISLLLTHHLLARLSSRGLTAIRFFLGCGLFACDENALPGFEERVI